MSTYTDITFTSDDGLTLHARDYAGAGGPARLPVICIHGLTRNASDFDELAPRIAATGRRVLALDVRGRGESQRDPNPDNYAPSVYAGDVVRLASDLGIARAVFIGTSMGGLITMTVAARRIDLVAAAILNDIGPVISEKGLARIAGYTGKVACVGSWEDAAGYVRGINACAFPDNDAAEWDKWARRAFAPDPAGRLAPRYDPNIAIALQTGKLRPTSLSLRMAFRKLARERPVMLVRGALSDLLEERQAAWMRRAAPAMTYVEVPNVGHAPMLTEPAALDAILRFLAAVP
ncbi:alpha/beta fold hydrolase [Massilia rhizosphaerae]|uniref:alpha/beta fold hydrolase n=1 Tax=Massilia rhizosphaerae TaxID=2784389 RepID=UPI0018DB153C|nr:alpha/beta hydrolase [Massilia rhizosphaerae]